jgi:hypothetical protein
MVLINLQPTITLMLRPIIISRERELVVQTERKNRQISLKKKNSISRLNPQINLTSILEDLLLCINKNTISLKDNKTLLLNNNKTIF